MVSHERDAVMVSFSDETEPPENGQLDKIKESNSPPQGFSYLAGSHTTVIRLMGKMITCSVF
jgi:hypothetical protein